MNKLNKSTFDFLRHLAKNNNREWFNENKEQYLSTHENVIQFADSVLSEMRKHDDIDTVSGKKSLYRIYRDVRFSKDKSPYKNHFSGSFNRATKWLRGGYYFHLEPGNVMIAGGFFSPAKEDLLRIREELAVDDKSMRDILNNSDFKKAFGELQGEQLKTAPKGFEKDHPAIDLIRYKQFYVTHKFADSEVLSPDFALKVSSTFALLRPYFNYMSEVLTTDANGLPID
jgi:uncharacterized protein (TIGR02453 family)